MIWVAVSIPLALYFTAGILLFCFQSKFIFCPGKTIFMTPADCGMPYDDLNIPLPDGNTIHAWLIKAANPRGTILFCHGNAGTISHRIDTAEIYASLGLNVLLFDYTGYGKSPGCPSEKACHENALAAWNHLTEKLGVPPSRVIVIGRSLGGAVAARLAAESNPAACILESSFTSIADVAQLKFPFYPLKLLLKTRFPTMDFVAQIRCPMMVVHSADDEIIPFSMGEKIFSAAGCRKQFLRLSGDHNETYFQNLETYSDAINRFITDNLLLSA